MFHWLKDNLVNFTTGLGVFGKDPTATAHYHLHVLDRKELENAYRSDWIARAIVDAPAEDATREWRGWFGNAEEIEKLEEVEKKLYLQRKMRWAIIRARLYGGAGLVLGIDDGRNTWEPVDWDACDKGCLKFVVVMNRYELMAGPRIYNTYSEWFTRPEYYTVATPLFGFHYEAGGTYPTMSGSNPNLLPAQRENYGQNTPWLRGAVNKAKSLFTGQEEGDYARQVTPSDGMVKMHPERVIELTGNELPDWRLVPMGGWWGDSVLQTADEMLKDFGLTIGGIANMVNDAKMDVIKVPGLSKSLANQEYANRLIQRFQVANLAKSTINALLLEGGPPDKAEEWQRISTSFSALPQIMHEYMTIAGAAGGIPMSRLMGSAPGRGLAKEGGGGGDVDIRNYYDRITSRQESEYRPALHPLDKAVKLSALGKDDPDVSYAWNPLYKENPLEQAQVALAKAQAYQIDVNAGLINSDVLREARINQLDADEIYPGLQDAIDQFGSEPEEPETPPWTPQSGQTGFPQASSGVPAKPAIPGAPAQKALPAPAKGPQSAVPPKPGTQLAKPVADRLLNEMAFLRDEIAVLRRPWADTVEAHVIGEDGFNPDQPRDDHGRWAAGAEHGLPEGSQFVEGRGILGKGKVGLLVPGHGFSPGAMIGNLHESEHAAAHEARQIIARKAASDQEKQQRASQLKGIASRLTAGEEPTHSDLATLGLKEKAGLKWFMPAAAELFGISSRAVRPHIAPLIHTGYSDMGAKYESVHSASGLKAIAAGLKSRAADALLDATPRTLYVRRDVLNGDDIVKWAKAQGFETTLPADDLHVTICYSRTPVDWMKAGEDMSWGPNDEQAAKGQMTVPPGGARVVEKFGDAIVLLFNSSRLSYRHEAIKQAGASFDFDEYQPHITITWEPGDFDWKMAEPYRGPIELGPEIFEEVNEDFRSEIVEDADKKRSRASRTEGNE